jgi:hypothetical protein
MIIELLKQKKHFLSEFCQISSSGLMNFKKNNFDEIDLFYNGRESLLEIIQYIDQKIESIPPSEAFDPKMIAILKLEIKALSQEILNQDMKILSIVDNEKSNIIKELQNISKNKKNVSSYKTKVSRHQIDEEI